MIRRGPLRDLAGLRLLIGYYLLTPVFALLDWLGVAPFRVAGLEGLDTRLTYYGAIFLIGVAARSWPRSAPFLGAGESVVNLFLLILAVMGPLWGLIDDPTRSEAVVAQLPARVVNLALAGGALTLSLTLGLQRLAGAPAGEPPR